MHSCVLISWVTSLKVAIPLRLTQLYLFSDVLVFVCFWGDVYVAITPLLVLPVSGTRKLFRNHINTLLALAFLHYKCIWVYSISSAHTIWFFSANFTYSFSMERPVSQSLLLCIWRWIWNFWIHVDMQAFFILCSSGLFVHVEQEVKLLWCIPVHVSVYGYVSSSLSHEGYECNTQTKEIRNFVYMSILFMYQHGRYLDIDIFPLVIWSSSLGGEVVHQRKRLAFVAIWPVQNIWKWCIHCINVCCKHKQKGRCGY